MPPIIRNLAVSLTSLLVTFIICEAGARYLVPPQNDISVTVSPRTNSLNEKKSTINEGSIDTVLDWSGSHGIRLVPNISATIHTHRLSQQDVTLDINSLGLRSSELSKDKGDEFRILTMGDSITLGDYLPEENTIPSLLQEKLSSDNRNVKVLNAGLPGACTFDEFYHYIELSDAVRPDIVLVQMYLNDAQNSEQFYAKKLAFPFSQSRFLSFISQKLHVLDIQRTVQNGDIKPEWKEEFRAGRTLKSGDMLHTRDGFDFEIYNASQDFGLAWNAQAWKNLEEIVDVFNRATKERNQKLLIYLLPVHMQVYSDEATLNVYPQKRFDKMCKNLGVECFDMLPTLREASKDIPIREMYYDHCHYRAKGSQVIARALENWIKKYVTKS